MGSSVWRRKGSTGEREDDLEGSEESRRPHEPPLRGDDDESSRGPAGRTGRSREFERGFLVGVLIGEGHFGGDGRQPQVTLRMHTNHESLFRWIEEAFPGGKLYGPYHHSGRSYYQWMARGSFLRDRLVPLLDRELTPGLDEKQFRRYVEMKEKYGL